MMAYTHGGHEAATAQLEAFVHNSGLADMARVIRAGDLPEDTIERLDALHTIFQGGDFRQSEERQDINWAKALPYEEGSTEWRQIFAAGEQLNMVQSTRPQQMSPDVVAILGGANNAPMDRLRYALETLDDFGVVAYLGSSRPLRADLGEPEKVSHYAPNARTEYDLGVGAFRTLLGAVAEDADSSLTNGDNAYTEFSFDHRGARKTGFVLNTPLTLHGSDTQPRATTYDNYKLLARTAEMGRYAGQSVVAVTTGFYVPAQHMPGVQEIVLPYNATLETIGHSAQYSGATRYPGQLVQEAKAAVDAAKRLHDVLENR